MNLYKHSSITNDKWFLSKNNNPVSGYVCELVEDNIDPVYFDETIEWWTKTFSTLIDHDLK